MYTLRGKQRRLRARFGKVVEQQANMRGHHLEGTAAGARGIGVDGEGVWLRLREEQQCPRDDDEGNHSIKAMIKALFADVVHARRHRLLYP